jgi:serine-type D-Ala-D-Ala carboxypeptidase/endopeptidase (penicillin-binding protein 4)
MKVLRQNLFCLAIAAALLAGSSINAAGQEAGSTGNGGPRPLLQPIVIHKDAHAADAAPLVKKTSSSTPSSMAVRSAIPVLAEAAIPGFSGVLVQTLQGDTVVESGSDVAFNPASNVKIATAYAVLKTFGPEYRFSTTVWTDGSYEAETGTIHGNLFISGNDPMFGFEHAVMLAAELNRMGIRNVQGDLVVTDNFAMNYSTSPARSSEALFATLNAAKRSAAANRNWSNHLVSKGRVPQEVPVPNVAFTGSVYVQALPSNVKPLFSHQSAPMREIIKVTLCYSNNFLSERLGDMLGGPFGIARLVQINTGVSPMEFSIQTASGLGINRVTPSAMMKLLRVLRADLAAYKMTFADIMPVAGIDKGTLERRFDTDFSIGSVIGKTGTLANTDGGVSSLAGEINTRSGKLLFVIFNQRGSVARFRSFQNNYVSLIQGQFGGASSITYSPVSLDTRLAKTRISYPGHGSIGNE